MAAGADTAFLVGAGRSGTTLLYKLLALHPGVAYLSNYENRLPWVPGGVAQRVVAKRPDIKRSAWFGHGGNAYFINRPWVQKLVPTPHEGESVYAACGLPLFPSAGYQPDATTCHRLRKRFAAIRRRAGAQVLVSKRTANNRRIDQLDFVFPEARYIHLIRDGRDVAHSLSQVEWWDDHRIWWDGRTPRDIEASGMSRLTVCARNWANELTALCDGLTAIDPERVIELRFEQLMAEPDAELQRLTGFLGLDYPAGYGAAIRSLGLRPAAHKWEARWSDTELQDVLREEQSWLSRLGYLEDE